MEDNLPADLLNPAGVPLPHCAEVSISAEPDPVEVPTAGASVEISLTKEKLHGKGVVPAKNASQLIGASVSISGMVATVWGVTEVLRVGGSAGIPNTMVFVLAILLILAPIVYVIFGNRRGGS